MDMNNFGGVFREVERGYLCGGINGLLRLRFLIGQNLKHEDSEDKTMLLHHYSFASMASDSE